MSDGPQVVILQRWEMWLRVEVVQESFLEEVGIEVGLERWVK